MQIRFRREVLELTVPALLAGGAKAKASARDTQTPQRVVKAVWDLKARHSVEKGCLPGAHQPCNISISTWTKESVRYRVCRTPLGMFRFWMFKYFAQGNHGMERPWSIKLRDSCHQFQAPIWRSQRSNLTKLKRVCISLAQLRTRDFH